MKKYARFFLGLVVTAVFLLTGCGADVDQSVTFYRDEAWEADMSLSIEAEALAMMGGDPAEIEAELDHAVEEAEAMGVKASWDSKRKDTTLIYTIHAKGEGFETLKEIIFDSSAQISVTEVEGKRQIYFSHPARGSLLDASQYTLTLTGGKIISSNGQQIDNRTVQWTNPSTRMEAVLTEKGRFSFGKLLLVLVLVAGVGGGGWFLWQKQQATPTAVFCATCGQPMNPQAQFCPKCGQKRQ